MMNSLPRGYVSLPEVEQHTDQITFSNLGLPVGFDDERLAVNLRAIGRVMRIASIGAVDVRGYDGKTSDTIINPAGNDNGVATAAASMSSTRESLGRGSITREDTRPKALVRINTNEVSERIRLDDKYPRGPFDPRAQATYLDSGLKVGFHKAINQRLITKEDAIASASMYVMFGSINASLFHEGPVDNLSNILLFSVVSNYLVRALQRSQGMPDKRLVSLFYRVPLDRLAISNAALTTSKLIKARS